MLGSLGSARILLFPNALGPYSALPLATATILSFNMPSTIS